MIEHFLSILSDGDLSYKKPIYIQKKKKKKGRYPGRKEEISNECETIEKSPAAAPQKGEERAP